jgi:hypothetical protein
MRQACGISGLAGNVENAGVPRPSKAWVKGSNPLGRTIKLLIYIDFIIDPFLPANAWGHIGAKFAPFYHSTQHLRPIFR